MTTQITLYEGTTEPIEDNLLDEAGAQVALDSTYLMEFMVVQEQTNKVIFYKTSAVSEQIVYDIPAEGHYKIIRTVEDTKGKAGRHVYILTVKKNSSVFHVKQGTLIVKGINTP